jgi:hypothetical protein
MIHSHLAGSISITLKNFGPSAKGFFCLATVGIPIIIVASPDYSGRTAVTHSTSSACPGENEKIFWCLTFVQKMKDILVREVNSLDNDILKKKMGKAKR